MEPVSAYLHMLDGRLRVKVAEVKGSPAVATLVETELKEIPGITRVSANPLTGNVLVLYDPDLVGVREIMEALRAGGYLREPSGSADSALPVGARLGAIVLRATTEFAIQHLITALI